MLFQFFILFVLAFVLVNPIAEKAKIDTKAEVLITIDWPKGNYDVDLWCEDPAGNIAWYNNKDTGFMHLDRDDLGYTNDKILIDGKIVILELNREIMTVRKLLAGEYICNVYYYSNQSNSTTPIEVKMRIEKLNPSVKVLFVGIVTLDRENQEKTMARFRINEDGYAVGEIETIPKSLARRGLSGDVGNEMDDDIDENRGM